MRYFIVLLFAAMLANQACNKNDFDQYKFSGAWKIERYTRNYYSNGNTDSSRVQENMGILRLYDNASELNSAACDYVTVPAVEPVFMRMNGIQNGLNWTLDNSDNRRLLFITQSNGEDFLAVYTVKERKRKSITLVIAQTDTNGNLKYDETLELSRLKP
jgi:hypothetical protein